MNNLMTSIQALVEIDKWKSFHRRRTAELRECFAKREQESDLAWEDREKWRNRANNNYLKYSTEAKELRVENERLRGVLGFYGSPRNWIEDQVTFEQIDDSTSVSISRYSHSIDRDHGVKARGALEDLGE